MISPKAQKVDMPIEGTFVGMVDRDEFDPWLRLRAQRAGADLELAAFKRSSTSIKHASSDLRFKDHDTETRTATARCVLGADGARSQVARQGIPKHADVPWVLAYHEIVEAPEAATEDYDPERCEVWYQRLIPDFYAWVFSWEIGQYWWVAHTKTSLQKSLSTNYAPSLASIRRKLFEKKAPPSP